MSAPRTWTIQTGTEPVHPMETDPRVPVFTEVIELGPVLDLLEGQYHLASHGAQDHEVESLLRSHGRLTPT